MRVVERLGSLQFDPLEVAGRNHDLILLARIAGYRREWTETLLYDERTLFETYNKQLSILPTSELPWYRIFWERRRRSHENGAFAEHPEAVEALLARIREIGPVTTSDVDSGHAIDWYWGPTRRGRALLEALAEAGLLGIARRAGNRRYYDLVERLFPADLLATHPSERDQLRHKLLSRHRAHGLLGTTGNAELWAGIRPAAFEEGETGGPNPSELRRSLLADLVTDGTLVAVTVDGIRGTRYVLADELPILDEAADRLETKEVGVAFLGPLDPFVWDRPFLRALYGFDYVWEVYVPAAKRRWGYYVLPMIFGDRLVGRIEPRFERASGTLRIIGLWWEEGFDPLDRDVAPGFVEAFAAALDAHRAFAGLRSIALPTTRRHRALATAVRDLLPRPARASGRVRPPRAGSTATVAAPRPNRSRRTIEAPNDLSPDS